MLRRLILLPVLALLAGAPAGCGHSASPKSEPQGPPWFADVTEQSGLDFVHDAGPVGGFFLPGLMGSGAALFDFDNDGRLDLYLLQNGGPNGATNRLYRQLPDGRFRDVSKGSGLDVAGFNMGVAIGDVNNDGWPDVLVTQYGGVKLFLNNGDGTFKDVTKESGLDNPGWGTSAAFVDYDRDGWLDLVVVNYVDYSPSKSCGGAGGTRDFCPPNEFPGSPTRLFHNRGPVPGGGVRFEDVTLASGLARAPGPGLGVFCADFDGDGWPDILVTNDAAANHLWMNRRDGTFRDEAVVRGLAYDGMGQSRGNMGIAVGDVDGDGLFDLFVTHLTTETNTLWKQGPRGMFSDRTDAAGLAGAATRGTGFGALLADFDDDGALDLAVVNGAVARRNPGAADLRDFWGQYAQHNQLLAGDATGIFRPLMSENAAFCGTAAVSRGLAVGDLDGDGGQDLLVTTVAGPARLFRNVAPHRGHWLLVRAIDPALKRDAYGAEVTVEAGGRRRTRWLNPGYSYLCSNDPRAHFGLGDAAAVDAIRVRWPDGAEETFPGRAADQAVVLRKGEGRR